MHSERKFINIISSYFPDFLGDDCAFFPKNLDDCNIISKDLLIEDVHFNMDYVSAKSLACKALQANLSDIAAQGGVGKYIMLGISVPSTKCEYMEQFTREFAQLSLSEDVIIVGGDTTASAGLISISLTVLGYVNPKHNKPRNASGDGDKICVIGDCGYAHLGWKVLEGKVATLEKFKKHFLFPKAKVKEGKWLAMKRAVTSMIDLSDGLYIDLNHICEASSVGAVLDLNQFIIPEDFSSSCESLGLNPNEVMLSGGEDYGLLITVKKKNFDIFKDDFFNEFGYYPKLIGEIVKKGRGVKLLGRDMNLKIKPFYHFNEGDAVS